MPLERLERRRPDATPRLHPVRSQIERAEEAESSQPVLCRETGNPPAVARADTVQFSPQGRVTPGDVEPGDVKSVERKAKVTPETNTQGVPADVHASVDEDYQHTRDELVVISENGRPEPTGNVRPAHQDISTTEPLNRIQPVESDKSHKEVGASESEGVNPSPASDEGNIAQESSGGRAERGIWYVDGESSEEDSETEESDDDEDSSEWYINTQGSDGDNGSSESEDDTEGLDDEEEYLENVDENDSETVSNASSPAPQRSQYFQGTPRRASARLRELAKKLPKEPSKATTSKRKTAPSQLTSDKRLKQRKRVKRVIEESDDCNEREDKEDGEGEDADRRVPHKVNRRVKISAQEQPLSGLQSRPPLSQNNRPWTEEEEKTLFKLREEGKTWEHIGEGVLGRTKRSVQWRWQELKKVASKPIEARTTRDHQSHNSSVISLMTRGQHPLPPKPHGDIWTKEEEETLFRLRKQGKNWEHVGEHLPGRTVDSAKNHWARMKRMALEGTEAQIRRRRLPHNPSVISPLMAETLKLDYRSTWSKEQDDKLISLRSQGLPSKYISGLLPGKSYGAVWNRWQRVKKRYPQVAPNSEGSQTGKKGISSIHQDESHFSLSTECDGEETEAEWNVRANSDSAMLERESSSVNTE